MKYDSCVLTLSLSIHHSGDNNISDLASVDSLNLFPNLVVRFILWSLNYVCIFILILGYAWDGSWMLSWYDHALLYQIIHSEMLYIGQAIQKTYLSVQVYHICPSLLLVYHLTRFLYNFLCVYSTVAKLEFIIYHSTWNSALSLSTGLAIELRTQGGS